MKRGSRFRGGAPRRLHRTLEEALTLWAAGATLAIVLSSSCIPTADEESVLEGGWQGTSTQVGDTLVVRTTAGSVWAGEGRLVAEAAIGTETLGENDLLGRVMSIAATSDRIFIADGIFTSVRVYDMDGNHITDVGREGEGPGEFRTVTAMGIDPIRGHLLVKEGSGIVHRLTLSGEYVARYNTGFFYSLTGEELLLRVTRAGVPIIRHTYLEDNPVPPPPFFARDALFTLDSAGTLTDTLEVPRPNDDAFMLRVDVNRESYRPQPVPFGPQEVWSISMKGEYIRGLPSDYRFEIHHSDGRITAIERGTEAHRVQPDERKAWEELTYAIMRDFDAGWEWEGPRIPEFKPFYSAIIPDHSGRLWVLREGEGRPVEGWKEPAGWRGWEENPPWVAERWFEVFEEETGHYLGRVSRPKECKLNPEPYIEGDTFLCLTEDQLGRPVVRRYRLEVS